MCRMPDSTQKRPRPAPSPNYGANQNSMRPNQTTEKPGPETSKNWAQVAIIGKKEPPVAGIIGQVVEHLTTVQPNNPSLA